MGFFKHLFEFYINSSIHVALAVCSLCWITLMEYDLAVDWNLLFFVFFASITSYNFVKYFGLAKFHHRRLANWLKQIQIFSLFGFLALGYFTFRLEFKTLLYLGFFGVITFLYAIPFLPRTMLLDGSMNLRAISGVKIYIIAFVWAGITVIIPLINEGHALNADVVLTFAQRYIYVIVATLPFEIRDMQFDSIKLATIPQKIGIGLTKKMGVLLMVLFYFIEFFKEVSYNNNIGILLIIAILTTLLIIFSKTQQSKYYSSFWVESLPILWLLLMIF